MNKLNNPQKGQAIVLIALGIVGLVGITALAIDGGNVFSERRHAQNAADTAALAGALELIEDLTYDANEQLWYQAADAIAISNGYDDSDPNITVERYTPPQGGCKGPGPYEGELNYVQVIIHQDVDTFFASIVGQPQTHSCVEAIAYAKPAAPPFGGATIVALDCHAKWAIQSGGTSRIAVNGGGLFSNSDHSQPVYIQNKENLVLSLGETINMVGPGGISPDSCNGAIPNDYPSEIVCNEKQRTPCPPLPADDPLLPQYQCTFNIPGDFKPPDGTFLDEGVYCIEGRFPEANFSGNNVTFVMLNYGIQWSGNSSISLNCPFSDNIGNTKGLLFYLPPTNDKDVTITGTSKMSLTGTILAPSSRVTLVGTLDGDAFHSSVIGRTIKLEGDGTFNFTYGSEVNQWYKPQISLVK